MILFSLYGEMLSFLMGKVSRCDVNFVKCKQVVFPLSQKVVFISDKNYLSHRDQSLEMFFLVTEITSSDMNRP